MPVSFPTSIDVTPGTVVGAAERNAMRADALRFGQSQNDAVLLAVAMRRWSQFIRLESAAGATKIRVPFEEKKPPTMMLNGCLLQNTANVDTPALAGAAGIYYVMAKRTNGQTAFTLEWSATAVEATDQRLLGSVEWNGGNIIKIIPLDELNAGGAMKVVKLPGYNSIPSGLVTGALLASNAAANTFGAWSEIRGWLGNEVLIVGFKIKTQVVTFSNCVLEIGTGGAGAEVAVSTHHLPDQVNGEHKTFLLPVPVRIALGTRIVARVSKDAATSYNLNLHLLVIETNNLEDL